MTILDNLPHRVSGKRRKMTRGDLGHLESFEILFSDMPCWIQQMGHSQIKEFALRGMVGTAMAYFTENPFLNEKDILEHNSDIYQVQSEAKPDTTVGLGVVYSVGLKKTTTGST